MKVVRPTIKVLDSTSGRVHAVVSDEAPDRQGDVIRIRGWDLEHFLRHPMLVAGHNYFDLQSQIGEWEELGPRGKRLEGVARYYVGEGNELADWGFNLARHGRAAYSVGFIPDMAKAKELGPAPNGKGVSYEYNSQELLEISHVVIPANPRSLQRMNAVDPVISSIVEEMNGEGYGSDTPQESIEAMFRDHLKSHADLLTRAVELSWKAAIASHSTETSDSAWDGPAAEARLKGDGEAAYYRRAFAWADPDKDANTKAAYRFIHHEVERGGGIGAANLSACSTGVGVLNGGRGGTTIPSEDKRGVWQHLARHLRDGDKEPPEMVDMVAIARSLVDVIHLHRSEGRGNG